MNEHLRRKIVDLVYRGRDGHIPSAFSIVDIVNELYAAHLRFTASEPEWPGRDYFFLSKGHGCVALYIVLAEHGFISERDLELFCRPGGILGEHPDALVVPGVEASTGSLGHGLPFAVGVALALKIRGLDNRVWVVVGDGECHEGTIWESANVAANLRLGNLCVVVDWNQSAAQLMPLDDLPAKWRAFGWTTSVVDGHGGDDLRRAFGAVSFERSGLPTAIVARTVKGKGVAMIEGHGPWHHRIPSPAEYAAIMAALT